MSEQFKIAIVRPYKLRIPRRVYEVAQKYVEKVINDVAKKVENKQVSFSITYVSELSETRAKERLKKGDFVQYLLKSRDVAKAKSQLNALTPGLSQQNVTSCINTLSAHGGCGVVEGNLSFASLDIIEELGNVISSPEFIDMTDAEIEEIYKQAGQTLGELMAHELGHNLGADHMRRPVRIMFPTYKWGKHLPKTFSPKNEQEIMTNIRSRI